MNEPWVLLRGLARERRHWEDFPDRLRARWPTAAVVTPELPGNGARFAERSAPDIRLMVQDLRRQLADQAMSGPFKVIGLSLGGMVAWDWLNRYPGEIRCAALINTSTRELSPFYRRLRPGAATRLAVTMLLRRSANAREAQVLSLTSNLRPDRPLLARRWARYASEYPVNLPNVLRQLIAAARYRSRFPLPPLPPVLLLGSQRDRLVHPDCCAVFASRYRLPCAVHPTAGHDLPLDDAPWVIERLTRWMRADNFDQTIGEGPCPIVTGRDNHS